MKKLLVACMFAAAFGAGSALAADAPVAPAARAYPAWNWTGFYFGGHTGEGFGQKDWQSATGAFAGAPFEGQGVVGGTFSGAQVGYNWQTGAWVWGAELSGSWADIRGLTRCDVAIYICGTKVDAFGSATGRLGYALDHLLLYGKGGVAVIRDKENMTSPFFPNVFNGNSTRWGWTVGAGLEYAFTPSWSAFVEYDYADFRTKSVHLTDQTGLAEDVRIRQNLNLIKLGLNYRFGSDGAFPLAARYVKAPILSEWTMEAGTRYWFSRGNAHYDLHGIPATLLNSRLTYGPDDGHALEAFARFDHVSGVFVKGFLGFGIMTGGKLFDEDFPPVTVPYSKTVSDLKQGRLEYAALDIGDAIWRGAGWKVGPFVGYRQYYQVSNGFGCAQIATNPAICNITVPTSFLGLTQTENWRGVAVGLNGDVMLTDRVRLGVDAAYLPYVNLSGFDNHWFRGDVNPLAETGHGWGTQIEAILSYALTDRWSVGVGGRYWYFATTSAHTQFPTDLQQQEKFVAQRYGVFAQTSYKFAGSDLADPVAGGGVFKAPARTIATNWSGFYVGGHAGGGWGASDWKSSDNAAFSAANVVFPGNSDVNGLLAGGQFGFRSQNGTWVWGVGADASWSDLVGTAKCGTFTIAVLGGPQSGTCHTNMDSLGTITASLGKTTGKFLFYSKAGAAWVNEKDSITSFAPFTGHAFGFTGSQTRWGWTFGSGIEYALTANWSVFAEYDYLGFGTKAVTLTDPALGTSHTRIDQHLNVVKVGANYKFDWSDAWGKAPVTAKY